MFFTRIDRSGKIVKTIRDRERERQGLVQLDSSSLTFDSTPAELSRRNIQEAIDNCSRPTGRIAAAALKMTPHSFSYNLSIQLAGPHPFFRSSLICNSSLLACFIGGEKWTLALALVLAGRPGWDGLDWTGLGARKGVKRTNRSCLTAHGCFILWGSSAALCSCYFLRLIIFSFFFFAPFCFSLQN